MTMTKRASKPASKAKPRPPRGSGRAYWLVKSEPEKWSWDDQVKAGAKGTVWDGVKTVSYTHLDVYKRQILSLSKGEGVRLDVDRGQRVHGSTGSP